MIGLNFKAAKAGFFDREAVINAVDKATYRIFSTFGRMVRKRAQKSLAYGDEVSAPGSPPTARKTNVVTRKSRSTGKTRRRAVSFLREFLFYTLDKSTKSVVIGPARLNNTDSPESLAALEYGGTSPVYGRGKVKRVTIRARPFMRPAAAAELPTLPPMWRDSVRS